MYQPLVPCADCKRHARAAETQCPFCGGALLAASASALGIAARAGRAAAFALGTSLSAAACINSVYGAPEVPRDAGADTGTDADAGPDDAGSPAAKYGSPPVDGG